MAKVKAISTVKHDGQTYPAGAVFEVTDRQAKDLKLAGVVKLGKDYKDPDKGKEPEVGDEPAESNDPAPDGTKTPADLAAGNDNQPQG